MVPEGKTRLEDLGVEGGIILKWIFNKWSVRTQTGFISMRMEPLEECFEHGSGNFGFHKCAAGLY
jgi:hypothetical protein